IVTGEMFAGGVDVGATETGTRGQQDDADGTVTAHRVGFADPTEVTIVAGDHLDRASGFGGKGGGVVGEEVPTDEALRQVGGFFEHAIGLVGAGEGETDAGNLLP